MTEKFCRDCKHCSPIVSQTADYYCYKRNEYFDEVWVDRNCDDFKLDNETMKEKEKKVW